MFLEKCLPFLLDLAKTEVTRVCPTLEQAGAVRELFTSNLKLGPPAAQQAASQLLILLYQQVNMMSCQARVGLIFSGLYTAMSQSSFKFTSNLLIVCVSLLMGPFATCQMLVANVLACKHAAHLPTFPAGDITVQSTNSTHTLSYCMCFVVDSTISDKGASGL